MAALPYIQLYVADYLADTAHLTTEENGAYLLLIFNYWQRGHCLDNAEDQLAMVCRLPPERWERVKPRLARFFDVQGDEWIHSRIERDLAAVAEKSQKAKSANAQRTFNGRKTVEAQTLHHTDTDTDTKVITNPNGLVVGTAGSDQQPDEMEDSQRAMDEAQPVRPSRPKSDKNRCPVSQIIDLYHRVLPDLPEMRILSAADAGHVRQLWRTRLKSMDEWEKFFMFVSKSDFLMGRVTSSPDQKPFRPNLGWLVKPAKFANIANRNYHS